MKTNPEPIDPTKIIDFLKTNLKRRFKEWFEKLNNPLATEEQFLEKEIAQCKYGMERTTELNNKLHHGQASILEYEYTNFKIMLEIAEKRLQEISSLKQVANAKKLYWKDLIKVELQETRLPEIEDKIQRKIENWKQGTDLIECAAFCQLLFDKTYFVKGMTVRKGPSLFALSKYGTNIDIQLESSKKNDRETHKKLLLKYFK